MIAVQNHRLKNGLLCILDRMHEVDSVAMAIVVKVGSRFEMAPQNGISHFLEHMAFKGTSTKTAKQIAEIFDDIGGSFNAYTSREHTVYHGKVLKEDSSVLISLLAEIVSDMKLDQQEIEREKGVIIQEIAMYEDAPDDLIQERTMEACYPQQNFGRSILGTPDLVNSFAREDFQKYVSQHYFAENMMVIVSGNLDFDEFSTQMEKNFSHFPSKGEQKIIQEKAIFHPGVFRQEKDLDQLHCIISFPGFSYKDENYRIADILSLILGGGMSSRLFQRIREELGLCYGIGFGSSNYLDTGVLSMQTSVSPDKINQTIDNVAIEMKKLGDDVTEIELQRSKKQIRASLLMAMERNSFRLSYIKNCYTIHDRFVELAEILQKIEQISISDIQTMMSGIFSGRKIAVSVLGKLHNCYDYQQIADKFQI